MKHDQPMLRPDVQWQKDIGLCKFCGQPLTACGSKHSTVRFSKQITLNSVNYPSNVPVSFPTNALDQFIAHTVK